MRRKRRRAKRCEAVVRDSSVHCSLDVREVNTGAVQDIHPRKASEKWQQIIASEMLVNAVLKGLSSAVMNLKMQYSLGMRTTTPIVSPSGSIKFMVLLSNSSSPQKRFFFVAVHRISTF